MGADMNRVNRAPQQLERAQFEMEPGDVLFFHCNNLRRSGRNRSPNRRWTVFN